MSKPQKRTGFRQGIYDVSQYKKEELGLVRKTDDGRAFVYCQAGAAALSAGKMSQAATVAAEVTNKACPAAAIGTRQMTLTIASSTYPDQYFAGGQLIINAGPGAGSVYKIESSAAVAAGTSITINLEEAIRVALTTSSYFILSASPFQGTVEAITQTATPTGVTPVAVPARYFYWSQVAGLASALCAGAIPIGTNITLGDVAGSVAAISATIATTVAQPIVGFSTGSPGVDTQYCPMFLTMGL